MFCFAFLLFFRNFAEERKYHEKRIQNRISRCCGCQSHNLLAVDEREPLPVSTIGSQSQNQTSSSKGGGMDMHEYGIDL
jgi:hypothetical protein